MKKNICGFLSVSTLLAGLSGCEVEDYFLSDMNTDDLQLTTGVASPLASSSISIADLISKQDVKGLGYDSTGMVVFTYDTIQHLDIQALNISGFTSNYTTSGYTLMKPQLEAKGISESVFESDYTSSSNMVSVPLKQDEEIPFTAAIAVKDLLGSESQQRIDSILFKKAPIQINLSSNITNLLDNCSVKIDLRNMKGEITSSTNAKATSTLILDLANSPIEINDADSIRFECTLTTNKSCTVGLYNKSQLTVRFQSKSSEMEFDRVYGVFNNIDPQVGTNHIDIDLYGKNASEGTTFNLLMADPKVYIDVKTNIGTPFSIGITKLEASNENKSASASFKDGSKTFSEDLSYAKKIGEEVTAMSETFNKDNGKIDELVNLLPTSLDLDYNFSVKEQDLNSKTDYFLTSDAYLDLNCGVELPFYLKKGSYIEVNDTIEDIEIGDDLGEKYSFETAKITAEIENSLPFNADVRFAFLQEDEDGNISLITDKNIQKTISVESATVDSKTDKVSSASKTEQVLEFTDEDIPSLKKAKHMLITYRVAVDDFEKVKVTKDNALKAKLKVYAKGNVFINKF